jgi:MYXO-CTERM domain-containing protein
MRGLATVLTIAFVFASSALLVGPVAGQSGSSGSLTGTICGGAQIYYIQAPPQGSECSYSQGLPGATVYLTQPGPVPGVSVGGFNRSATSDSNGYYSFSNVPAGDYAVKAVRTGFDAKSASLTVASGSNHRDLLLEARNVTISGTVSNAANGQALSGAEVRLCCPGSSGELKATSGSDGRFSLDAKAGWHSLSVRRPGFQERYDYALYDGAAPVNLALEAMPPQDAALHGVVRDHNGNPVAGATVTVSNYGGCCYPMPLAADGQASSPPSDSASSRPYVYHGSNWTTTDAQGAYRIHVYSGENSVSVQKEGFAPISTTVRVASGEDAERDLTVKKYPEKTARIEGRITDAKSGAAVRFVQVSVQSPEFGLHECSVESGQGGGSSGSAGATEPGMAKPAIAPYPGDSGCAITVHPDGRFEGVVTPGYAIVQVYYESWRACSETHDADGSSSRTCGPEYNSWSRSLVLPDNATTTVNAALRQRPAPDAVVSGYLIDAETGQAIPGAQISFSNEDTYGYGWATTDKDGSYSLRLRSGYHQVYAHAEGHLRWQGVLDVKKGDNPFDVELVPGFESYGGYCCYAYAEDSAKGVGVAEGAPGAAPPSAPSSGSRLQRAGTSSGDATYEDLGGGLGPYNAADRKRALSESGEDAGIPAPAAALLALGLVALAALRRRRA